ncbi:MAG: hypothetical protein ATN33_00330 [Epulopiscium sp. Nele67-Bin001]|nr:MAG: hypothetical protein BEN18_02305 [Epulopiscium sp. Nuni2H_MBin001]OON94171.1 MAG: hypothetical protein ATN33_00330 [Epulopiscium sp. Nele67-Bin001]
MDLFKGMGKFGLEHLEGISAKAEPEKKIEKKVKVEVTLQEKIDDALYNKKVTCPICDTNFITVSIKSNKNRFIRTDDDLKPYYTLVDPILYDVIHCACGYTALSSTFMHTLPTQRKMIREQICASFQPMYLNYERTVEESIELYRLALLVCVIKKGKDLEKAILCLRLAWLCRDVNDKENENMYLENALSFFETSIEKDTYPALGVDFHKASYLIAVLAYECGQYEKSLRTLGRVIAERNVNAKIKDRLLDFKPKVLAKLK